MTHPYGPSFGLPRALVQRAVDLISRGLDESDVYQRLTSDGIEPQLAWAVAVSGWEAYYQKRRDAAVRKMMQGALWLIAGMLLTVLCYSARVLGGVTYVVAYAPMAIGIVVIFCGIYEIPPERSQRARRGRYGDTRAAGYGIR